MFGLEKYKDLFGKPNTGIHKYRVLGISILDVAVVVVCGIVISKLFRFHLLYTLVVLFISGIIIHRLFGVRTGIDKKLFPNAKEY
jgi:hypothetical protein